MAAKKIRLSNPKLGNTQFSVGPLPSFDLYAGDICLVVGESGSGKSSLFEALAGQLQVLDGSIVYDSKDLNSL